MTGQGDSMVRSLSPKVQSNFDESISKKSLENRNGNILKFNNNYKIQSSDSDNTNDVFNFVDLVQNSNSNNEDKNEYSFKSLNFNKNNSIQKCNSNDSSPLNKHGNDQEIVDLHADIKIKEQSQINNDNSKKVSNRLHHSGTSKRSSTDFRKKSTEQFLHLREESLTINTNTLAQAQNTVSSPSTPSTPRLSTISNNHSPQQQRSTRPPFLASKHSQIIPVLSVNDVVPNSHSMNNNVNHINMTTLNNQTPNTSVYSKSARNSVTNINQPTKDEIATKLVYPTIDPNAIKEYNEATKKTEFEVIDYKNKERKTLKVEQTRDDELVKKLTHLAKNNESGTDLGATSKQHHSDMKSMQSKTAANNDHNSVTHAGVDPNLDMEDVADDTYSETIVDGHTNFTIAYNMLSGIKASVSKYQERVDKKLRIQKAKGNKKYLVDVKESDFTNTEKLKFVHKDKLLYSFKFKDYAPQIFSNLRKIFKIEDEQYLESLTSKYVLSELNSPGKSGSFFYYSPDNKYIIKTIRKPEHKHLRNHLKQYYEHCEGNPETLLSQFYGLYRMKLPISLKFTNPPKSRRIYFIVMNNVFPMHIDQSFDLKGSLLGRMTDVPESKIPLRQRSFSRNSQINNAKKHSIVQPIEGIEPADLTINDDSQENVAPLTLKDLNWLDNSMRLELDANITEDLKAQLSRDVSLLKRLNTMDYSLLIGIHFTNTEEFYYSDDLLSKSIASKDGNKLYFIGIIDCLTNYSFIKKIETLFKSITHPKSEISAVPPDMYGKRFVNFMEQNVLPVVEHKANNSTSNKNKKSVIEPLKTGNKIHS
ncbi:hypothetical protein ACO0SA_004295 [Hanseniaspora valbyensis]